jgi:hypothetical protein
MCQICTLAQYSTQSRQQSAPLLDTSQFSSLIVSDDRLRIHSTQPQKPSQHSYWRHSNVCDRRTTSSSEF